MATKVTAPDAVTTATPDTARAPRRRGPSLNRVSLIGRLTADPKLRYTPNGTAVASFRIANNGTDEVQFHNISAWRGLAEIVSEHLSTVALGGLGVLAWGTLKVGALSYGGGFVIVPLMQHDAVVTYHWMTGAQFLNAVALGQITPGPVVQTVAVVGYAAGGIGGGLTAAAIAFAPSFLFILIGGPRFDQIRANSSVPSVQSFLIGAGPAVIGAIAGSAIPLGLSLQHLWQIPVLAGALLWLFVVRRGVVSGLLLAGAIGVVVALAGISVQS